MAVAVTSNGKGDPQLGKHVRMLGCSHDRLDRGDVVQLALQKSCSCRRDKLHANQKAPIGECGFVFREELLAFAVRA